MINAKTGAAAPAVSTKIKVDREKAGSSGAQVTRFVVTATSSSRFVVPVSDDTTAQFQLRRMIGWPQPGQSTHQTPK